MKCEGCNTKNADHRCIKCGAYWCEECSANMEGYCECTPRTIVPIERYKELAINKKKPKNNFIPLKTFKKRALK